MDVIWSYTAFQKTNFYGHSIMVVRYFQERIQKVDFCPFSPANWSDLEIRVLDCAGPLTLGRLAPCLPRLDGS